MREGLPVELNIEVGCIIVEWGSALGQHRLVLVEQEEQRASKATSQAKESYTMSTTKHCRTAISARYDRVSYPVSESAGASVGFLGEVSISFLLHSSHPTFAKRRPRLDGLHSFQSNCSYIDHSRVKTTDGGLEHQAYSLLR